MAKKTSEELTLLISYLSLIGIWFAIPSVALLLNKDKRWPIALGLLITIVSLLVFAYIVQWRALFPQQQVKNQIKPKGDTINQYYLLLGSNNQSPDCSWYYSADILILVRY